MIVVLRDNTRSDTPLKLDFYRLRGFSVSEAPDDFEDFAPSRELTGASPLIFVHRRHELDLVVTIVALASGWIDLSSAFDFASTRRPALVTLEGFDQLVHPATLAFCQLAFQLAILPLIPIRLPLFCAPWGILDQRGWIFLTR